MARRRVFDSFGTGNPVVVMTKLSVAERAPVNDDGLVKAGAWRTVRVNAWVTVPWLFVALIVNGYVPPVPGAAFPASVAVPLPLFVNVIPAGSVPDRLSVGVGVPVARTVNDDAVPTVNVFVFALVIANAWPTVNTMTAEPIRTSCER